MSSSYAVLGGAGFIGHHFVEHLLKNNHKVLVIDNFSSGTFRHIAPFNNHPNFEFKKMNIKETKKLQKALTGYQNVIHLASNPDISKAATDPRIDFVEGTVLTESVVESSRLAGISRILYASGSGVYGDAGENFLNENSPLVPISTYGASKLAGETLLSSYSHMFGIKSFCFRFANVVGARQTHGVCLDFLQNLVRESKFLHILGNGMQSKSYVYVQDIISAVLLVNEKSESAFDVFNISTRDAITVNQIADLAIEELNLSKSEILITYSGGDRGWKADVPIVRLDPTKIESFGWKPKHTSFESIKRSLKELNAGLK